MACLRVALLVTLFTVSRGIESLCLSVSFRRSHFGESTTNVLSIPISHTRENLFPFGKKADKSLLSTPTSIFHYLDFSEKSNGGFLLDVGHLLIASNYFDFDNYL